MKITHLFIVLILLFNCTSSSENEVGSGILTDVATLETSFGAEDEVSEESYLLARPRGIGVTDDDKIVVADENYLKVYDKEGNPLQLIGGEGEGPGEYKSIGAPVISPTGFMVVRAGYGVFNYYRPGLVFDEKKNVRTDPAVKTFSEEHELTPNGYPYKIFKISDDLSIMNFLKGALLIGGQSANPTSKSLIVIAQNANWNSIGEYEYVSAAASSMVIMSIPHQGSLNLEMTADKKIVHAHPQIDKYEENGLHFYKIFVSDYEGNTREIIRQYNRIALPDSIIARYGEEPEEDYLKDVYPKIKNALDAYPYYQAFSRLLTDGDIIYVFTYAKNDNAEHLVDIFDADEGKYLKSAYFPVIPNVIKNGYAYFLRTGGEILPSVEVYKVSDKVYGK